MPTKQQLELIEKFKTESMLRTLDLSGFGLDRHNVLDVGSIIRNNPLLEKVILCHNNLGDLLPLLFNTIFNLPHLRLLDIVDNNITEDSTYRSLSILIKYKPTLDFVYIGAKVVTTLPGHPQIPLIIARSPLAGYGSFFSFLRRDPQTMRLECTSTPGHYSTGFNEMSRTSLFELLAAKQERDRKQIPIKEFYLISHSRMRINQYRMLGSEKILESGVVYNPSEYREDLETKEKLDEIIRTCPM